MNTHDIKLPPIHYDELPEPDDPLPAMFIYGRRCIEPYQRRIEELESQLEAIGAGGVSSQRRGDPVAYMEIRESGTGHKTGLYKDAIRKLPPGDYDLYLTPQPAELVLDAPAQVGSTRFGKGIKWSTIIAAAQRRYAYENTPTKEQERIKRAAEFVKSLQSKGWHPPEPVRVPSDAELVAWATEEQFFLFCDEDEFLDIARALLARYGQPVIPAPMKYDGTRTDGYVTGWNDCVATMSNATPEPPCDT